jgi:toxin ParE1/3/4
MAYRVIWSPRALDDVDSIASYIARDSLAHASAVVAKIIRTTRLLKQFPFAGRVVPEFEDESLRERFAYGYRELSCLCMFANEMANQGKVLLRKSFAGFYFSERLCD